MAAAPLTVEELPESAAGDIGQLADLVFHEHNDEPGHARFLRLLGDPTRRFGARDEGALVGSVSAFGYDLSIPGGELPCAGVAFVGVAPTHRRRGLLSALMGRLLQDAVALGQPLAALYAAEGAIYGRYGFGVAVRAVDLELGAVAPLALRVAPDERPVRFVALDDAAGVLGPIHGRWRARRPGMPSRTPAWWRDEVLRPEVPQADPGLGPVRIVALADAGYAIYRSREGLIQVEELVGDAPAVEAALWRWLASVDLVDVVRAENRPVDDPLPRMLLTGDDGAPATRLYDTLWVRLLDLPAALAQRSWATDVDLAVEVADAVLPANAGTWRIRPAACERTDATADLALDVRDLGAVYLGGITVASLAEAGVVRERTQGAVDTLDAALRVAHAPLCPEHF